MLTLPNVRDLRPSVRAVQFDDESTDHTRVIVTLTGLCPGDRVYVNVAPFGRRAQWVAAEVIPDDRDYVIRVRVIEESASNEDLVGV